MLSTALRLRGLQENMAAASSQPGKFSKLITGQSIKSSTGSICANAQHQEVMRTHRKSQVQEQKVRKCTTSSLRLLRFSPLGKHGAALVGLPNLLKEHEILQGDDKHQ